MAGRLRLPIIFFLLSIAPEKGTLGDNKKKTVGHYLGNLHGGFAPDTVGIRPPHSKLRGDAPAHLTT